MYWSSMNYAFLPDLLALSILIVILILLRRRHPQARTDLWLAGLLITLVESASHTFYAPVGPPAKGLHIVVVDCYLLAGLVFVWASGRHPFSNRDRFVYVSVNAAPLLVINTMYGLHLRMPGPYLACIGAGLSIGLLCSVYIKRSWRFAALYLVGWLSMVYLVETGDYRRTVYWSLCCVYTIAALNFQRRLARGSTGKLAIVTGFTIWSLCLFLHPWTVGNQRYAEIASHIWNMQKSLISIGMILVMLEEQISSNEWLALHDELTGLPNRRLFADRLTGALDRARRSGGQIAVMVMDLNCFKKINDSQGHAAGDQVLCGVADNLRRSIRSGDTLARLGGDEFILVAADLNQGYGAEEYMDAIQGAFERPVMVNRCPMTVSASIGMAVFPEDADDAIGLLRVADMRMYATKQPEFLGETSLLA
jgi:diguanylate cyclase